MKYNNDMPIYFKVIRDLKKNIITGQLPLGAKMPSNRELAVVYKVNPNTAARIYKELELEGLCYTKRGLGTFVTGEEVQVETLKEEMARELLIHFMNEMRDIGFQKKEILTKIEDYEEGLE